MADYGFEKMTRTQMLNAISVELFYSEFQDLLVTTAELKQSLIHLRRLRDLSKSTQNYLELSAPELRQLHIEKQSLRKLCYHDLPEKMAFYVVERRHFEARVAERLSEICAQLGQDVENQTPLPENFVWQQIQPDTLYIIEEICAEATPQVLSEFKRALQERGEALGNLAPILNAAARSVCVCPTDEVLNSIDSFGSRLRDSLVRNSLRGSAVRGVTMK